MARRAESGTPVSFFSFQDIITCISGIMIFVVLLLVLDTTTGALSQSAVRPQASAGRDRADVRIEATDARDRLATLERRVAELTAECARASAADRTRIAEEISRLEGAIQRMEGQVVGGEAAQASHELTYQKARRRARKLQEEIREVAVAKRALETAMRRRVLFTLPENEPSRSVVILECSGKGVTIGLLEANGARVLARVDKRGDDVGGAVRDTLRVKHPPSDTDALVIVKPSAFDYGEDMVEAVRSWGYRVGSEPLEEDRTTLGF